MAVYFATNGIDAVLEGFNQSYHRIKNLALVEAKVLCLFVNDSNFIFGICFDDISYFW